MGALRMHPRAGRTRRRLSWIVAGVVIVLLATGGGVAASLANRSPGATTPVDPFYVDPTARVVQQVNVWQHDGHAAQAAELSKLAREPFAHWFTGGDNPSSEAAALTARASVAGKTPVFVLYDIPFRDCASYSGGGAATSAAYRSYVAQVAGGVGQRKAIIVVEPDAVAQIVTGCVPAARVAEREADLRQAVTAFRADTHARVYLDAGNPGWITDPARLVGPLMSAGVRAASGFALNVSNFQTTAANVTYGTALSARLGGTHFVVDTSRNGRGPVGDGQDQKSWCNPAGRAAGPTPTTTTGDPLIDAFLWIKITGESDGSCHAGDPPAGTWWPAYALMLAAAS